MGLWDRDNAQEGKEAIRNGDVKGAMESADRQRAAEDAARDVSRDREHGGLDSFKK